MTGRAILGVALLLSGCSSPPNPTPVGPLVVDAQAPPPAEASHREPAKPACDQAAAAFFRTLSEPMDAKLWVASVKRDEAKARMAKLRRLAALSDGRFRVEQRVVDDADSIEEARTWGLSVAEDPNVLSLELHYRSDRVYLPAVSFDESPTDAYGWLTEARNLADGEDQRKRRIGVLAAPGSGFDEPHLAPPSDGHGPTLTHIFDKAIPNYAFVPVTPETIGGQLGGLVVTQRDRAWTEDELRRIDAYVQGGGSVVFLVGAANVPAGDRSLRATLDRRGVERLLDAYGFELHHSVVRDPTLEIQIPVIDQSGATVNIALPGLLEVQHLEPGFLPLFGRKSLTLPWPSSLKMIEARQPNSIFHAGAWLSASAVAITTDPVDLSPGASPLSGQAPPSRLVAAAVTNVSRSAFGGRAPRAGGRVLVIASPHPFANPFARALATGGTDEVLNAIGAAYTKRTMTEAVLALKRIVDWLVASPELLRCGREG